MCGSPVERGLYRGRSPTRFPFYKKDILLRIILRIEFIKNFHTAASPALSGGLKLTRQQFINTSCRTRCGSLKNKSNLKFILVHSSNLFALLNFIVFDYVEDLYTLLYSFRFLSLQQLPLEAKLEFLLGTLSLGSSRSSPTMSAS